jgi:RHS repeat-associated protein
MSAPFIRGFQLDASAIGDAAKSVNLFRGDVNLPLKLVHLPGPHSLDLSLDAYYSSNVDQQWDTWNLEAPTGIMGLGWSLPFSQITFNGNGTASWLEGRFTLQSGGNPHPLTLLSYTGSAENGDESLTFADALNPLWQFTYTPATEAWEVVKDDGVVMVFGDQSTGRNTVQWGVRWDNWAGNSTSDEGTPSQFAVAWNLTTTSTPWGNAIAYSYQLDSQPVTSSLSYTRACYLSRIVDGYGRTVTFTYDDKDPLEYQAPHTVEGGSPGSGYQDRYETQYLARIDVYGPGGTAAANRYYAVIPIYELHDPGHSELSDTCKRYLVSVSQQRNGIDLLPAMQFAYQLDPEQPGSGRLTQVTYPAGGTVSWQYEDITLADPNDPDNIFNLSYTAYRPTDSAYAGATPRLWFGADYVIVGWYTGEKLSLWVYSYGGRWSEPWSYELDSVEPQTDGGTTNADKLEQIRVAMGPDFFAMHYHNTGNSMDTLHLFQKATDQFGRWTVQKESVSLGTSSVLVDETALVAGNDFVALHVGGTSHLFRFRYSPLTREWTADDPVSHNSGATRIALATQNNTLAACFFAGSGTVSGETVIYYLKGDYTWSSYSQFNPTTTFTWDSSYVWSYWASGPGFLVGTCLEGGTAHLQFIKWQRNFAGFSQASHSVTTGSQSTLVGGNAVYNGNTLYRCNGDTWVQGTLGRESGDLIAAADDVVLRVRKEGSYYSQNELATFDPVDNQWRTTSFQNDGELESYAYPSGPQFCGNFLTVGNQVFYRGTDNDWQPVAAHNPLPHVYGSTVANLSPGFIVWQNADNRENPDPGSLNSYAALPKNGDLLTVSDPFTSQKIQSLDGSGILCGANAFATYDAEDASFSKIGHFTLHRTLNHKLSDPTDTVVKQLTIDTADQRLATSYQYDADQAVFDASGAVAQYPKVTARQLSAVDGSVLSRTDYEYFNGLSAEQANNISAALDEHYSLAAGYLNTVSEYNADEELVAKTVNTWTPIVYSTEAEGGFCPIANTATLKSESVAQQRMGLTVTPLDGSKATGDTATLTLNQTYTYDPNTAFTVTQSATLFNADGVEDTRTVALTYAWTLSEYAGMRATRQLQAIAKSVHANSAGDVQAVAQTFTDSWGAAPGVWDKQCSYVWKNSQGTGKAGFDFSDPDGNSDWIRHKRVTARNALGFIRGQEDALGVPTTTLYDAAGSWPIARLTNAKHGAVIGFQPYEDLSGWQFTGDGAVQAGDAHTGSRCAHLLKGASLGNDGLSGDQGTYVFSCWVKGSGTDAAATVNIGSARTSITLPQGNTWQYVFKYLTVAKDNTAVSLSVANSGSGELLLDDLRFTPLASTFSAKVYDANTYYDIARLGANGETSHTFYDDRLRSIGSAGPDQNVNAVRSEYWTASGLKMFDNNDLNSKLEIRAGNGGVWDDFRDGDGWQDRWTAKAGTWQVKDQALCFTDAGGQGTVSLNGSSAWQNYTVYLRAAQTGGKDVSGALGLSIGNMLTVRWNPSGSQWELLINGSLKDSYKGNANGSLRWLLIAGSRGVVFHLNDRAILSYAAADNADPIIGALSLFASDPDMGFSQVLVARDPLTKLTCTDGTGRKIQTQQLADNQIVVSQRLFDELGRKAIQTKPVIYDQTVLGYQAGFVNGFDYDSGVMTGDVADYYRGQDGRSDDSGYPYTRRRIENSSLSRLMELGQPGAGFAIGAKDGHTTGYDYGVNGPSPLFAAGAQQSYNVRLATDPDGMVTAEVKDQIGNRLGHVMGAAGLPQGSSIAAYRLDGKDNPAQVRSPNYFDPPSGEANDWGSSRNYNYRNKRMVSDSSDSGNATAVRDDLGRLRFQLIADGDTTEAVNPCCDNTGSVKTIIYQSYDALGRTKESGYYCVDSLESAAGHANDLNWPADAANWRYRFSYDGSESYDGGAGTPPPFAIGRVTRIETNDPGNRVTESYLYDIRGKVAAKTLDDGVNAPLTTGYDHDALGRVTRVEYPALGRLGAHSVSYDYDKRGLLAAIGTPEQSNYYASSTYNAAGQVETSVLGSSNDPITRVYTYASPGWLKSITDNASDGQISREELFYEDSPEGGGTTPRYNGSVSAIRYQRSSDAVDDLWRYTYDTFGRLREATLGDGLERHYAYDPNGNPNTIADKSSETTLTYSGSNRLVTASGIAFTCHPSGEVAQAGDLTLGYDFVSRLTTTIQDAQTGLQLAIGFGAGAQRLSKTSSDGEGNTLAWRRYIPGTHKGRARSLLEQAWDRKTEQTRDCRYIYGQAGLLAVETKDGTYFVLKDHQQSSRLCLSGGTAAPVATFDFLPFGQAWRSPGGSDPDLLIYRYTGQEWDAESGFYNYRHRLYDPATERFYSPDPKRQYFSPYLYVGDEPLLHTDPTGEFSFKHMWHSVENSRTFGFVFSSVEIAAGAGLMYLSGGAMGEELVMGGVAGMNYTIRAKHFNASQFLQVDAAALISTAEIEAGVALKAATFGGSTALSDGLIGAGMAGLTDTFIQINKDPNGKFNWKEWGIAEGIGFAVGAVTGGLGELGLGSYFEAGADIADEGGGESESMFNRVGRFIFSKGNNVADEFEPAPGEDPLDVPESPGWQRLTPQEQVNQINVYGEISDEEQAARLQEKQIMDQIAAIYNNADLFRQ